MMRRTVTAMLAVVITLSTLPAAAENVSQPLEPRGSVAMRSDLREAGYRNGRLPNGVLVEVDGGTRSRCLLESDAALTWRLLMLAAEHDGITGFDAGWCYRTVEQQRATRERNCDWVDPEPVGQEPAASQAVADDNGSTQPPPTTVAPDPEPDPDPEPAPQPPPTTVAPDPEPNPDPEPAPQPPPTTVAPDPEPDPDPEPAPQPPPTTVAPDPEPDPQPDPESEQAPPPPGAHADDPVDSSYDPPPILVCGVPTAVPGHSNHGWGRAIDVVDTTGRRASVLSCRDPQFEWLVENGPTFGWVLPPWARCGRSTAEPWHWEWAGLTGSLSQLIIEQRAARGLEIPR